MMIADCCFSNDCATKCPKHGGGDERPADDEAQVVRGTAANEGFVYEGHKLPINIVMPGELKTTMRDVGGYQEAKLEVIEFANFLRNREHYERLGAKVPKGAVLFGPPGTGKTLLARATAGEAKVPFIACNSADFLLDNGVERLKLCFKKARSMSPCILFLDELDIVGRKRPTVRQPLSPVHHALLECLLVEMDGFNEHTSSPIVVLGATNDEDDIDPALLRPGRFDRLIAMDEPDLPTRMQIVNVHLSKLVTHLERKSLIIRLAHLTPGLTGAKLFMLCNEAAMIAARQNKESIEMDDFERALHRIRLSSSKPPCMHPETMKHCAYHDAGHAVFGWFVKGVEPPDKLSLFPVSEGKISCCQAHIDLDEVTFTKEQCETFIAQIMAGRAAELVCLGTFTSQCENDLEDATNFAYKQITNLGMNERFGLLSLAGMKLRTSCSDSFCPFGSDTKAMIADEGKKILEAAFERAKKFVEEHKQHVVDVAERLIKQQMMTREDLLPILGERPFANERSIFRALEDSLDVDVNDFLPEGLKEWNK